MTIISNKTEVLKPTEAPNTRFIQKYYENLFTNSWSCSVQQYKETDTIKITSQFKRRQTKKEGKHFLKWCHKKS